MADEWTLYHTRFEHSVCDNRFGFIHDYNKRKGLSGHDWREIKNEYELIQMGFNIQTKYYKSHKIV